MPGAPDPLYVAARRGLLDALDAVSHHLDAVILAGAQAVYIHTGEAGADNSRVALGQSGAGRYLRVIYVPDPDADSEEALAEDEAAFETTTETAMIVPTDLVPTVRDLISRHRRTA